MRRLAGLVSVMVIAVAIAGCAAVPRQTPAPGELIPGPILTFPVARQVEGGPILTCAAFLATNPVRGFFEGDPTRSSQVAWLRAADGGQLTVAWPEGFIVRFEPDAVLYNERGLAVARHGQEVELEQVNVEEHAGTLQDPYIASGIVFDQCYHFAR